MLQSLNKMISLRKNWKQIFLLVFFLGLAAFMLFRYVNLPYVGPNATDQNKLSMIARNYNYFGFLNTKFQPIILPYKTLPENPQLYFNHGVLMEVITSVFMKAFGYDFWVGRIPYIIAAFLVIVVLFLIGREVKNKNFAILVLIISVLIPATSVFGRMIQYQGSFSVFFITLTALFTLKYLQGKKRNFFYLALICGVLGVLTDWPITYFSIFLLPLFIKNKKGRDGIILSTVIIAIGILQLLYINNFIPLASGLVTAITNRSLGTELTTLAFWPINWVIVIFVRLLIYFNPILILFSSIFAFSFFKRYKAKKLDNLDLLTFAFFAYGITYVIMFPEGSFGHPHWIYGLVPAVALAASTGLFSLVKKKFILLALIIILSIIYVLVIENWKTNQNLANLYRYDLAKSISKHFIPYDTIYVNGDTFIDYDLYNYAFLQIAKGVPVTENINPNKARYYVYSCICDLSNNQVNLMANKFKFEEYSSPPARVFIFFLNEKQDKKIPLIKSVEEQKTEVEGPPENLPKKIYRLIVTYFHVPQL